MEAIVEAAFEFFVSILKMFAVSFCMFAVLLVVACIAAGVREYIQEKREDKWHLK